MVNLPVTIFFLLLAIYAILIIMPNINKKIDLELTHKRKTKQKSISIFPEYYNIVTTIVRVFIFSMGFFIMVIPYGLLKDVIGLGYGILHFLIVLPGFYIIIQLQKKIKVGKHYSEKNKIIKDFIKDVSNKNDHISEIERLSSLNDKGIITDKEFESKKKELLGRI